MQRLIMAAVLAALGACAPAQKQQQAPSAASAELPAPTPDDVAVRIGADQAGQTVSVNVGERFAVELIGIPTAGYVWEPANLPAFLTRAGETSGDTVKEQSQPGYAGGSHWQVFLFAATAPGSGALVMEMRRPWETDEPPAQTFTVTIAAR